MSERVDPIELTFYAYCSHCDRAGEVVCTRHSEHDRRCLRCGHRAPSWARIDDSPLLFLLARAVVENRTETR